MRGGLAVALLLALALPLLSGLWPSPAYAGEKPIITVPLSDTPVTIDGLPRDHEWRDGVVRYFASAGGRGNVAFFMKYGEVGQGRVLYVGFWASDFTYDGRDSFSFYIETEHNGGVPQPGSWSFTVSRDGQGLTMVGTGHKDAPYRVEDYPDWFYQIAEDWRIKQYKLSNGWGVEMRIPIPDGQIMRMHASQSDWAVKRSRSYFPAGSNANDLDKWAVITFETPPEVVIPPPIPQPSIFPPLLFYALLGGVAAASAGGALYLGRALTRAKGTTVAEHPSPERDLKSCPKCSHKSQISASFCEGCGASFEDTVVY